MNKSTLRNQLLTQRASLSFFEVQDHSAKILHHLLQLPEVQQAYSFFIYVSIENEVYTHALIEKLLHQGKVVTVPKLLESNRMDACRIISLDQLIPGSFAIPQPIGSEICDTVEVCIIPGVAFTEQGYRLGRGGGYYDHFLAEHAVKTRIAVAYDFQILPKVPQNMHDKKMDYVVTEKRVIPCG